MSETAYVSLWVKPDTAKKMEQLKGTIPDDDILQQYIEKAERDIHVDLSQLDDDVLQYRANLSRYRKDLSTAYNDHLEKLEQAFNDFDSRKPAYKEMIAQFKAQVEPMAATIKDLDRSLQRCSMWNIEKLLELIRQLHLMSNKDRDLLLALMSHQSKETS